jgi:hypothetical protein
MSSTRLEGRQTGFNSTLKDLMNLSKIRTTPQLKTSFVMRRAERKKTIGNAKRFIASKKIMEAIRKEEEFEEEALVYFRL